MSINPAQLPDDVQALKALVVKLEGDYERRLGVQVAAYHRELTRFPRATEPCVGAPIWGVECRETYWR